MQYRSLGRTGLKVSEFCLGSMQFGWTADEDTSLEILSQAFDAGVNFIDSADVYSRWVEENPGGVAERIIGKWLKNSKIPRDQVVIATKVRARIGEGPNDEGLSRAHVFEAVEGSLERLGTDYIDLYQTHFFDTSTSIEETLIALDDLIRQGKVRYIGCSNHPSWRLMRALWTSDKLGLARYDSLQPHYNLVHRAEFERELAEVCDAYELGVLPYSPLAGGFLTGKYRHDNIPESARLGGVRRYFNDRNWELLGKLENLAQDNGDYSMSQVALAWLLSNPLVTSAIIGPRNLEQLEDNLGAASLHLTQDEMEMINKASEWREG